MHFNKLTAEYISGHLIQQFITSLSVALAECPGTSPNTTKGCVIFCGIQGGITNLSVRRSAI